MEIEIIKSKRKTVELQICQDGHIRVRAPQRMKRSEINALLEKKSEWIHKHLHRMEERKREQEEHPVRKLSFDEIEKLADEAVEKFPSRVKHFAELVGVDFGKITIRNQKTRWGSCSSKGNLNFNCLLMLAPEGVQDYVIIHELCHRKEMNHSKRFWDEVEKVMPDYKEKRRWLKENGEVIMSRVTKGISENY